MRAKAAVVFAAMVLFGAAAHALFAGWQITAMFEYREERLRELLGSRSRAGS